MTRQAPHGAFPEISHDEMARQDFTLRLREYVAGDIAGRQRHGVSCTPSNPLSNVRRGTQARLRRKEVRKAMERHPFHQAWGSLNRATQEMIWDSVPGLARPAGRRAEQTNTGRRQRQGLTPPQPGTQSAAVSRRDRYPLHARQLPHRIHRRRCLPGRVARPWRFHVCARPAAAPTTIPSATTCWRISTRPGLDFKPQAHSWIWAPAPARSLVPLSMPFPMPKSTPSTCGGAALCATATSAPTRWAMTFISHSKMPKRPSSKTKVSISSSRAS